MNSRIPMSLTGAVDLGALAAANEAKAQAEKARKNFTPGNTADAVKISGAIVREMNEENLRQVLETSAAVPFIVVFQSTHSENSIQLREIFEKLAKQYQGRFGLAHVSADKEVALAQAFGVSAVPAAIALLQGQPVPLFQGLPSENEIIQTVERLLASAAQYGISAVLDGNGTEGETASDSEAQQISPLHQAGLDALNAGDLLAAREAYMQALKENPGDAEAKSALNQVELLERMDLINPQRDMQTAQKILAKAAEASIDNIVVQMEAADIEMACGRVDAAFARLLDVIADTDGEEREQVRKRLLSLFETLGANHELVKYARKELAKLLF